MHFFLLYSINPALNSCLIGKNKIDSRWKFTDFFLLPVLPATPDRNWAQMAKFPIGNFLTYFLCAFAAFAFVAVNESFDIASDSRSFLIHSSQY